MRESGVAERGADLVLTCEGGSGGGTANVSFDIFINAEVTSRSYEPILLIGDPSGAPTSPLILGTNLFQATSVGPNSVQFQNIPVPRPEAGKKVVLRFSNLRLRAASIGAAVSGLPNQAIAFISSSPSGTLPINNPMQTLGYVYRDLFTDLPLQSTGPAFNVCTPHNRALATNTSAAGGVLDFSVRFKEGFESTWLPRVVSTAQNKPGVFYASESGFYDPTLSVANNLNTLGLADTGTRLALNFFGIPSYAKLYVTTTLIDASDKVTLKLVRSDGTPIPATTTAVWDGQSFPVAPVDPSSVE